MNLKKTTDDCYTPDNIYEAVRKYAIQKYGLQGRKVIRPFYPGGDYKKEKYPKGCVVIDNPPFSILAEIKEFYHEKGVDYFLFAPTLTLFRGKSNFLITNVGVRYENGAIVNTSFVTNLGEYRIEVCPDLCEEIERINNENAAKDKRELKAKDYPIELVTAARLGWLAKNGQTLKLRDTEVYFVSKLDEQKENEIYGGGFLISERAAAERAAAERFELSEREKEIVRSLGK